MAKRVRKIKRFLIHANGDLCCGMNIETTGSNPNVHEIVYLTCVPLDAYFNKLQGSRTLDLYIRPERPDLWSDQKVRRIGRDNIQKILDQGMPKERAYEMFTNWFSELDIKPGKRIIPVAFDWLRQYPFFTKFVGENIYTTHKIRDVMVTACHQNDRADFDARQIPFPQAQRFNAVLERLGMEIDPTMIKHSLYKTRMLVEAYKKLIYFERFL